MRYIRTNSNSKQNKENSFFNEYDKERIEDLKLEIKSAYTQINMLKETNKKLSCKISLMEKQIHSNEIIRQQIQFLKEQQDNYKQQLNNQDEINRKLREQLDKTEKQKNQLQQRLKYFAIGQQGKLTCRMQANRSDNISLASNKQELSTRINQYKSIKTSYQITPRLSMIMNSSNQRSKQNHQSTPKSKMKINLDKLMAPQNPNHRKRVFF